jgi:simple sugar transport system permease protein
MGLAFLLHAAMQAVTPILLAALGGALCSRAGVFNIALEGQMLLGAFAAVAGSTFGHAAWAGVLAASLAATAFALILACGTTLLRGDPIVIGIGMNLLASGLTAYLLRQMFGVSGTFSDPRVLGLVPLRIVPLERVPLLGALLSGQTGLTWLAWATVAGAALMLFRTPAGLRLRGVGEAPEAAAALGVDVAAYRVATVLSAGALTGLAGAQLALGTVSEFTEDMSAGRGWIAVVAVMLGRANPLLVAGACVLFGLADAVGIRLQASGLPSQLTDVAPYVVTLAALVVSRRRSGRRSGKEWQNVAG